VRLLDGSGVNREVHAPFCERLGVRFPRPTHHETFNTLKNLGYHFEHNYGHGKKHLASVFANLMMLMFLIDQIQECCCALFKAARQRFRSRTSLWEKMRGLFLEFYIEHWEDLFRSIIFGHKARALQPDTS